MRIFIAVALVALSATQAIADPKIITVERCAKIEASIVHNVTNDGDRYSQTVKCIGAADADPHIASDALLWHSIDTAPYILCLNQSGCANSK